MHDFSSSKYPGSHEPSIRIKIIKEKALMAVII